LNRSAHGIEQAAAGKGLDQARDGAGTLGGFTCGWLVLGRDEDDELCNTAFHQPPPQFRPGQAGQMDVEDKTSGARGGARLQERFRVIGDPATSDY